MDGLLVFGFLLVVYLVPTIVACTREHPNAVAIGALNILAGWTFIGYIVALVWALVAISAPGRTDRAE